MMGSQEELRDLLRLMTTGRNKLPMMAAMGRVKSLQAANIRSITDIAKSDIAQLTEAVGDDKAAKQLQTAAKNSIKDPSKKRSAPASQLSSQAKRHKSAYELVNEPQTPQELEARLELPAPSSDEEEISKTTIVTNRAPLVLAFAVTLLKYTMPEQPLSSRLSLAQAVVSANSRSKAVSIGITKGASAEDDGWGQGQPRVKVMGREVYVLKRDGYFLGVSNEESTNEEKSGEGHEAELGKSPSTLKAATDVNDCSDTDVPQWTVSQSVTLKKSTFTGRAIGIKSPSEARSLKQELLASNPELRDASHNITAWRVQDHHGGIIEECHDDGESGGGNHVLRILQSMDLTGVLVVVTRWYGGIMLGTDRWKLMTQVCHDALSQRLRVSGTVGQEALWGLDLEAMRSSNSSIGGSAAAGLPIHKPEGARSYIMKAFAPSEDSGTKKKTGVALEREKERNLGLLFGALELLFASWMEHIGASELDKRAWSWYVQVRPDVESGAAGWGGKGEVKLINILNLRRKG